MKDVLQNDAQYNKDWRGLMRNNVLYENYLFNRSFKGRTNQNNLKNVEKDFLGFSIFIYNEYFFSKFFKINININYLWSIWRIITKHLFILFHVSLWVFQRKLIVMVIIIINLFQLPKYDANWIIYEKERRFGNKNLLKLSKYRIKPKYF